MNNSENSISLTNIEMKIHQDKNGCFKEESIEFLGTNLIQITARMKSGVSPSVYKELEALKNGIDCATEVLQKVWETHHGYIGKRHTLHYSK